MFTGLVEAIGTIKNLTGASGRGVRCVVSLPFDDVKIGDSICVSGVCVTVTEVLSRAFGYSLSEETSGAFGFFLSEETLSRSKFASLAIGSHINLERALRLSDRLGGHIVQGHVDEVGELVSSDKAGESRRLRFKHSGRHDALVVEKGSIAVDGVSLTVSGCSGGEFSISVIPHTLDQTTLKNLKSGQTVNLEFDLIAKCVLKGLEVHLQDKPSGGRKGGVNVNLLKEHGFA